MKLTLNYKYMILQGFYWMLFCVASGFMSLCLQSRGLNNQEIGIATAVFGITSALLQPLLGRICDKFIFLSWKKMIFILAIPFFIISSILPLIHNATLGVICFGILFILGSTIMPFINSALSSYRLHGECINFGVSRGIGSGMYALLALLIGNLSTHFGVRVVSYCGSVISLIFIVIVCFLPYMEYNVNPEEKKSSVKKGFLSRYPAFIMMYAAFILLFTSHNLVGTYLLQIIQSFGGTSKEFGTAIAIQAVVEVPVLFIFSLILKKVKPHILMVIAACGYGIKAIWYFLAGSIIAIYFVQSTQIISFALFASASVYYTMDVVRTEDQITGQALMTSVMAIGTVIGSLSGGWLLEHYGISTMLFGNIFIAGSGIILSVISNLMLNKTQRRHL